MLIPIYEDEMDEFDECTYKVLTYDIEGSCRFLFNEKETLETQIEIATCRPIDELLDSQLVCVCVRGECFSLENTLEEDMSDFLGEEITIECCWDFRIGKENG